MIAASTVSSHLKLPTFLCLHFLQPPLKPTMPSRPIAPAPPATLSAPTKVPGQVTVTMESSIPQAPTIPVATISGQQVWCFFGGSSVPSHRMVRSIQVQLRWAFAAGGKVKRSGFPIQCCWLLDQFCLDH